MIIDVRTEEEYREVHILSAVSAPPRVQCYLQRFPRIDWSSCIELAPSPGQFGLGILYEKGCRNMKVLDEASSAGIKTLPGRRDKNPLAAK
jgi:rhodanese-related sulfurtransferase